MSEYKIWAEEVLKKVRKKMEWVSEKNRDKIPYTTLETGSYDDKSEERPDWGADDGLYWWTNGFWGGIMWMLYQDSGQEQYAQIARVSEEKLKKCFQDFYGLHHDIGFMFLPTAVADYKLTGNEDSKRLAMFGANLLAGRFNPVGRFIRAWNQSNGEEVPGWAIIDCMMNISLLYWASRESGDPRFSHIAQMHADTAMKNFIRPDGSVRHIVEFDPETGEMVKSYGGQGYGEGSSWTRGQGWVLYGKSVRERHNTCRLQTAKRAGMGGFLRSVRDCRRAHRNSRIRTGTGKRNVSSGSGKNFKGDCRYQGGLDQKLRCHCAELFFCLSQQPSSHYDGVCRLLFC